MDYRTQSEHIFPPLAHATDDAVGVAARHWYVAIVNHHTEQTSAERIRDIGLDSYVATQQEMRVRNSGRKVKVDRVVIPSKVFVRCTEPERKEIVTLPFINRFMTNIAAQQQPGVSHKPLAVIPEWQMQMLRFMLANSDTPVTITSRPFVKGERVRVVRGSLKELEGEILNEPDGSSALLVGLNLLGFAKVAIDPVNVEHI